MNSDRSVCQAKETGGEREGGKEGEGEGGGVKRAFGFARFALAASPNRVAERQENARARSASPRPPLSFAS